MEKRCFKPEWTSFRNAYACTKAIIWRFWRFIFSKSVLTELTDKVTDI